MANNEVSFVRCDQNTYIGLEDKDSDTFYVVSANVGQSIEGLPEFPAIIYVGDKLVSSSATCIVQNADVESPTNTDEFSGTPGQLLFVVGVAEGKNPGDVGYVEFSKIKLCMPTGQGNTTTWVTILESTFNDYSA